MEDDGDDNYDVIDLDAIITPPIEKEPIVVKKQFDINEATKNHVIVENVENPYYDGVNDLDKDDGEYDGVYDEEEQDDGTYDGVYDEEEKDEHEYDGVYDIEEEDDIKIENIVESYDNINVEDLANKIILQIEEKPYYDDSDILETEIKVGN